MYLLDTAHAHPHGSELSKVVRVVIKRLERAAPQEQRRTAGKGGIALQSCMERGSGITDEVASADKCSECNHEEHRVGASGDKGLISSSGTGGSSGGRLGAAGQDALTAAALELLALLARQQPCDPKGNPVYPRAVTVMAVSMVSGDHAADDTSTTRHEPGANRTLAVQPAFDDLCVVQVAVHHASLIVTANGELYGLGAHPELGLPAAGATNSQNQRVPRPMAWSMGLKIRSVAVNTHALALTEQGRVYTWGAGERGQLGHGNKTSLLQGRLVNTLESTHVVQIACGALYSAAVTDAGKLYTWGCGSHGRLGHSASSDNDVTEPKCIPQFDGASARRSVTQVALGYGALCHTLVLTRLHQAWSFGSAASGKLGRADSSNRPALVEIPEGVEVASAHCGEEFTALLSSEGTVYTCGSSRFKQLGRYTPDGDQSQSNGWEQVKLGSTLIRKLVTGPQGCVALTNRGAAVVWGLVWNEDGTVSDQDGQIPTLVPGFQSKIGQLSACNAACGATETFLWREAEGISTALMLTAPFPVKGTDDELCTLAMLLDQLVRIKGGAVRSSGGDDNASSSTTHDGRCSANRFGVSLDVLIELLHSHVHMRADTAKTQKGEEAAKVARMKAALLQQLLQLVTVTNTAGCDGDGAPPFSCAAWTTCLYTLLDGWNVLGGSKENLAVVKEVLIATISGSAPETADTRTIARAALTSHWKVLMPTADERIESLGEALRQHAHKPQLFLVGFLLDTLCDYGTLCANPRRFRKLAPQLIEFCSATCPMLLLPNEIASLKAKSEQSGINCEEKVAAYRAASRLCTMYLRVLLSRVHTSTADLSSTNAAAVAGTQMCAQSTMEALQAHLKDVLGCCEKMLKGCPGPSQLLRCLEIGSPLDWVGGFVYSLMLPVFLKHPWRIFTGGMLAQCSSQILSLMSAMRPFTQAKMGGSSVPASATTDSVVSERVGNMHLLNEVCHIGLPLLLALGSSLESMRAPKTPRSDTDMAVMSQHADLFLGGLITDNENTRTTTLAHMPESERNVQKEQKVLGVESEDAADGLALVDPDGQNCLAGGIVSKAKPHEFQLEGLLDSFITYGKATDHLFKNGHFQVPFAGLLDDLLHAAIWHLGMAAPAKAWIAAPEQHMALATDPMRQVYSWAITLHNQMFRGRRHAGEQTAFFRPRLQRATFLRRSLKPAFERATLSDIDDHSDDTAGTIKDIGEYLKSCCELTADFSRSRRQTGNGDRQNAVSLCTESIGRFVFDDAENGQSIFAISEILEAESDRVQAEAERITGCAVLLRSTDAQPFSEVGRAVCVASCFSLAPHSPSILLPRRECLQTYYTVSPCELRTCAGLPVCSQTRAKTRRRLLLCM